jgi:hypothetical protein
MQPEHNVDVMAYQDKDIFGNNKPVLTQITDKPC